MSWRSRAALIFVAASVAACARNPKPEQNPSPLTLPARVGAAPPGSGASAPASNANPFALDQFDLQRMFKRLTDLSFMTQLGSEMIVRKVTYSGADKLPIPAYFFAPKDTSRKRAALIFVHDGIHGDLSDTYVPLIRSLVRDGYVIVAPEYRGSTGYGKNFYDAIDYGGKEVDDVLLAREFLRDVVPYADLGRLGIIGWSHGGFITLHSIFRHPEFFRVAIAHVPVADLPARMRTHDDSYQSLFSNQAAYGGTYAQKPQVYIARSPVAHVRELKTPLLVHAASNDDDVFIIENRNLRDSMVAAGKDRAGLYRYREFADPPGGHGFNRIQTKEAKESLDETLAFLRKYLHPERSLKK
ncbi:MAG TPA: prolyl oligopeptidase family serine peptidase [Gemmatimonadaceae bacterium]|nr:prolyl oligopeptidase family serine peptidase [Gemmatimonadaceae bacterium]